MQKTKTSLLVLALVFAVSLGVAAAAKSQNANGNSGGGNAKNDTGNNSQNVNHGNSANSGDVSQNSPKANNGNQGGQAAGQNGRDTGNPNNSSGALDVGNSNPATNPAGKTFGNDTAALHRSVVAGVVHNLLSISQQDSTIGSQVKVVAIQQVQDEIVTDDALQKVETRNKVKTFLIGADYKNLGALRSQYAHTRNHIRQLTNLMNRTTDETTKATLAVAIASLNTDMVNLNTFITTNQDQFSLFGWFFKLFTPVTPPEPTPIIPPVPTPTPEPLPDDNNTAPQNL